MDSNSTLENYANKMPEEIRFILKGLSDDDRIGIVIALLENGKMTFSEMKEKFDLNSSSLTNHLSILQKGNLIENFYEKNEKRVFSYYDVTDIPELIFNSILNTTFKSSTEKKRVEIFEGDNQLRNIYTVRTSHQKDKVTLSKKSISRPKFNMDQQPAIGT